MVKMNLSDFCPDSKSQFESTCYSYAVVYTALSAEFNIKNNITDRNLVNTNHFSSGVVASKHNSNLPFYKWSPKCGRYGTANKSLKILKDTGTVFSSQYDCNCKKYSKIRRRISQSTTWYKISDYQKLEVNNKYSEDSVNWIISALKEKHPVIIGLYQNSFFKNIKSEYITEESVDDETNRIVSSSVNGKSNHVVCIVGYDLNYRGNKLSLIHI